MVIIVAFFRWVWSEPTRMMRRQGLIVAEES